MDTSAMHILGFPKLEAHGTQHKVSDIFQVRGICGTWDRTKSERVAPMAVLL